jgi:hypothetical protein
MMEALLGLLTGGPSTIFAGLAAALAAAVGIYVKGRSDAKKAESLRRVKAGLDAAVEQLEMHREADEILRTNVALSDAEARAKAKRDVR